MFEYMFDMIRDMKSVRSPECGSSLIILQPRNFILRQNFASEVFAKVAGLPMQQVDIHITDISSQDFLSSVPAVYSSWQSD